MKRYTIDKVALWSVRFPLPTESQVISVIKENNDDVIEWIDPITLLPVYKCKNKPRDMPFFGIHWIEA